MDEIRISEVNIGVSSEYPILFSHMKTEAKPEEQDFHLHDTAELYVYVSGNVDFIISDSVMHLSCGDVLTARSNELHRAVINGSTEYERYYVTFPAEAFDSFSACTYSPAAFLLGEKGHKISLGEEKRASFLKVMEKISALVKEDAEKNRYLAYSYFLRALYILNEADDMESVESAEVPELIREVMDFISKNYASVTSVSEIASHFHVSTSYLSSLFSSRTHVGLKKYLQYRKISEAKRMLASGAGVTDTCFECGFNSCSHFIAVFREATGTTPNKYRAAAGKDSVL